MRTIESEFPDYDNVQLHIPPFVAEPWHNDTCPRYVCRTLAAGQVEQCVTLWVDYKDPAKREDPSAPQFYVTVGGEDGSTPLAEFWGETDDELRSMLAAGHFERAGKTIAKTLPLGELMKVVGAAVYTGKEQS